MQPRFRRPLVNTLADVMTMHQKENRKEKAKAADKLTHEYLNDVKRAVSKGERYKPEKHTSTSTTEAVKEFNFWKREVKLNDF